MHPTHEAKTARAKGQSCILKIACGVKKPNRDRLSVWPLYSQRYEWRLAISRSARLRVAFHARTRPPLR
ncbi:MAG: hypothetical protein RIR37_1077 [Verrucomicrobiota bacterium]